MKISIPYLAGGDYNADDFALDFLNLQKTKNYQADLPYKPAGKMAIRFHNSKARIRFLRGPIGCGKTVAAFKDMFGKSANAPLSPDGVAKSKWVVVRNTYGDFVRGTLGSFDMALPDRWKRAGNFHKTSNTFHLSTNVRRADGSDALMQMSIIFMAMDRMNADKRFKGMEMSGLFIDEANESPPEVFSAGASRLGRYPGDLPPNKRPRHIILASNSFDEQHPLYPFFYDEREIQKNVEIAGISRESYLEVFDYPSGLSPEADNLQNLPNDYYPEKMAGRPQHWIDVMVHNEFGETIEGRPCYKYFTDKLHAAEYIAPRKDLPLFCGIDFGRDSAVVVCQQDEEGNIAVVDADYRLDVGCDMAMREMFARFAERYPPSQWNWKSGGSDPGGEGSQLSISPASEARRLARDIGVCPTNKCETNDPAIRINAVNTLMAQLGGDKKPRLRISKDKNNRGLMWLIRAMTHYQYKMMVRVGDSVPRYHDAPDKNDESHIAEALQYALLRPNSGIRELTAQHRDLRARAREKQSNNFNGACDFSPYAY